MSVASLANGIIVLCILGKVDGIVSPDSSQWLPSLGVILPLHQNLDSIVMATMIKKVCFFLDPSFRRRGTRDIGVRAAGGGIGRMRVGAGSGGGVLLLVQGTCTTRKNAAGTLTADRLLIQKM